MHMYSFLWILSIMLFDIAVINIEICVIQYVMWQQVQSGTFYLL